MEASKARLLSLAVMNCPNCNSTTTKVIETRICDNGSRRRRHRCFGCEHRWTIWNGERPMRGGWTKSVGNRAGRLTHAQIRLALTRTDLNNRQMGELIDCSAECVRQIRCGQLYVKVLPDLLRPNAAKQKPASDGPNCLMCQEWRNGECLFGFPDPLEEGLSFAADCDLYAPVSQSMSRA